MSGLAAVVYLMLLIIMTDINNPLLILPIPNNNSQEPRHVNHVKLVPSNDIIIHHLVNPVRLENMQIILAIMNVFSVHTV